MDLVRSSNRSDAILLELALEGWRFQKLFSRAMAKLDPMDAARFANQQRYFVGTIDRCLYEAGMRLIDLEGQAYDTGTAATALNIADFGPDDVLVVAETIDPIIMNDTGLLRTGTVMVRKVAP